MKCNTNATLSKCQATLFPYTASQWTILSTGLPKSVLIVQASVLNAGIYVLFQEPLQPPTEFFGLKKNTVGQRESE